FNRPFDPQGHIRIRLETEAKFHIQDQIKQQRIMLIWSYILDFENAYNPFVERREAIAEWQKLAEVDVEETQEILDAAHSLRKLGLKSKDALHIACAIEAGADYFITTDDLIIKKTRNLKATKVVNPLQFIEIIEGER
ncbi:MAG: PIN domain-containing protein, partial [Chloroflexi bacterium]|nr:PIN domain-containing protein [Chloroflexota bacterium]